MNIFADNNVNANNQSDIEKVMWDFLKAISEDFRDKFIVKGCLALKSNLGDNVVTRGTRDIDFTITSKDVWESIVSNACTYATNNSELGIKYEVISRRGFDKNPYSDSIKIRYNYNNNVNTFRIDMNIKSDEDKYKCNMLIGTNIITIYNIYGILTDKINVLISKKACRRIKDLIDIYFIIISKDFELNEINEWINIKGLNYAEIYDIGDVFVLNSSNDYLLEHAYSKYKTEAKLPKFEDMLIVVKSFISKIIDKNLLNIDSKHCHWDSNKREWN